MLIRSVPTWYVTRQVAEEPCMSLLAKGLPGPMARQTQVARPSCRYV